MSQAERALAILHEWVKSESLRKHCYAVADSMKHFAQLRGEDVDLWEALGLLHDMDYEKHPNLERSPTEGHPFVGVKWLRENGWSEEVCRAILSHADYSGVEPQSPMEKTLRAVDELSGFIVAVTLVRPSKNITDVELSSVKKKMKDKAFARAVTGRNRPRRGTTRHAVGGSHHQRHRRAQSRRRPPRPRRNHELSPRAAILF